MAQLSHFMKGLTTTSTGGILREKPDEEVKTLIKNMYRNEYHLNEWVVKGECVLAVDIQSALLAQLTTITKHLVASQVELCRSII